MNLTAGANTPYSLRKAWMVMRLTSFFILILALHLSAKTSGQNITISSDGLSMEKFFNQLQKQSGYSFILETGIVKHTVSVHVSNASLETVLDMVLQPLNLTYIIKSKLVYIINKTHDSSRGIVPPSPLDTPPPIDIHGRVTDSLGNPLSGASVFVKGTRKGAITDARGEFTIKGVAEDKTLVISFTGYINKEYKTNSNSFEIVLKRSNNPLDQVQVIAYGTTTQRLSTGDQSVVTAATIERQPVGNVLSALEGQVPGLVINQTSGVPGGAFTVQIRGQNSLTNGNDPFYVVDGVPYLSQTANIISNSLAGNSQLYGYNSSAGNPLNYINASDIESISVLKDADATSIYGSRAANGAIIITTKKGKAGDSRVDLNVYSGVGEVTRMMDLLNTQQYLTMRHEAFNNDGASPDPNADFDLTFWDTTRYTNWQKVIFGNRSQYNDAQLSISGGNENTQYLIGGGYHRETSVFPGTFADQKASAHFNLNSSSLNKKFKISFTANYTADMSNMPSVDITYEGLYTPPDAPPLYNSDGTLNWAPMAPGQVGTWTNPLSPLIYTYKGRTNNLISNTLLTYTFFSGFNVSASLGYSHTQTSEIITYPIPSNDPGYGVTSGSSRFNNTNTNSLIVEPQASYSKTLGKGVFKVLIGGTFQENSIDGQGLSATGFSNDAFLEDIQAASSITGESDLSTIYKYTALFGRLNYNWEDKFILNVTARRDGSSRFGPSNQFANFASIGGAWIFSRENFIQETLPFLSFGKLRASYGTSGNDQIGDYRFLDLYVNSTLPYQNSVGLYPANLYNPNLAWELNKKLEVGTMLGFLKDRITAEVSYYVNRSGNQLVTEPLSSVTGFSSIPTNLSATVQNSGVEIVLNTVNITSNNFKWTTSFNISLPNNKLISFPNLESSSYANRWIVGQPISIQKVFKYKDVNDSAGIYEFASSKGTTTFNPSYATDKNTIVNLAPKLYGGFENSFWYKGFQLDVFFQFVSQTAPNFNYFVGQPPGFIGNYTVDALNRWQKPGDQKAYEQFTQNYGSNAYSGYNYYETSNAVYTDASFIRLKNIAFSYTFSEIALHKMHIRNLRLYVNGQNLITITKYLGLDPESQGVKLPPMKVLVAGIQFGL